MAGFGKRHNFSKAEIAEEEQLNTLTGFSTTKIAVGFCVAGLLAALFLTPVLDTGAQRLAFVQRSTLPNQIDTTVTGAIEKAKTSRRYIIRRSVMQKNPSQPCYIFEDGSREGGC